MSVFVKQCPFCAEEVAEEAIKCKHCGSMLDGSQPPRSHSPADSVFDYPPKELTIPMLVSAAWNVMTAVFWTVAVPCVGAVIAVPYIALAIFEFTTFQKAAAMSPQQLYDRCGWLGGLQILFGFTNAVPVICGIFLFAYRDRLLQYREIPE